MVSPDAGGPISSDDRCTALVDDLLDLVGHVIHDGPVQHLIAAKLLIESVIPVADRTALADRAIDALVSAHGQSRQLMWALATPTIRPGLAHVDLPLLLPMLASDAVTVDVSTGCPEGPLTAVARAIHHVAAGAALGPEDLVAVHLHGTDKLIRSIVTITGDRGDAPSAWERLAELRVRARGGSVAVARDNQPTRDNQQTIITLEVPV